LYIRNKDSLFVVMTVLASQYFNKTDYNKFSGTG